MTYAWHFDTLNLLIAFQNNLSAELTQNALIITTQCDESDDGFVDVVTNV